MSQNRQILSFMKQHRTITPIEALDKCGCFRRAARIYDLKSQGHSILTEKVEKDGKSFARYRLIA